MPPRSWITNALRMCTFSSQRSYVNWKRRVHKNNPDWWNPKIFCDIGNVHNSPHIFCLCFSGPFSTGHRSHLSTAGVLWTTSQSGAHLDVTEWRSFLFLRRCRGYLPQKSPKYMPLFITVKLRCIDSKDVFSIQYSIQSIGWADAGG